MTNAPERSTQDKDSYTRSYKKVWVVLAVFLGVLTALTLGYKYLTASPPGYCAKQGQYFSDQDYLQIVLVSLMKSGQMKLGSSDTSAQAYLLNHPNCCKVYRGTDPIFDLSEAEVDVTYELSEQGRQNHRAGTDTYYLELAYLTSCGEFVHVTGTTMSAPAEK